MRSLRNIARIALLCMVLCAGGGVTRATSVEQIAQATEQLRKDTNLGIERKQRSLRWNEPTRKSDEDIPGWLEWFQNLVQWFTRSAEAMVWVVAAILASFIAIYILRLIRDRKASASARTFMAPSHVRDLDIRPESLPADIGAAALTLWEGGEHRRALALLYRGLLSRMVHVHQAPVRDSTTEGECIDLARRCLPAASRDYAALLVTTWQRAVYGDLTPDTEQVRTLCAGFAVSLNAGTADGAGKA